MRNKLPCSIDNCLNPRNAHGMCVTHDERTKKGQSLELSFCRADECENSLRVDNIHGYCATHIWRSDLYKENKKKRITEKSLAVNQIKLENGCSDCGYDKNALALQFDHVEDNKTANVSRMVGDNLSLKRILAEIEKCEVVCANCHAIRTGERRGI